MHDVNISHDRSANINVTPPRPIWFDFLLLFGSFGIYAPFWMVSQVRDLKKLSKADATPWLWFFVPYIPIVQLFALPRLGSFLRDYEYRLGIASSSWYPLWGIGVFIVAAWTNTAYRYDDTPIWTLGIAIGLSSLLFSLLKIRINHLKQNDEQVTQATNLKKYRWWELGITFLGVPCSASLLIYIAINTIPTGVIETYEKESTFTSKSLGFEFPIQNVDWKLIENPDNEDAHYTFVSTNRELEALVYEYDSSISINDVLTHRYDEAISIESSINCVESISNIDNSFDVKATQECKTSIMFGTDAFLTGLIKTDESLIELYITVSTAQEETGTVMRSAKQALRGFKL